MAAQQGTCAVNDLLTFQYQDSAVRIIEIDDAPWFVAADVAGILGYRDAPNMLRNLDDDETATHSVSRSAEQPGTPRLMTIISESGLYNAIFCSRRPEAKAFRRWVTGTVLPELRRTGQFLVAPPAPQPIAQPLADVDTTRFSLALQAVSLMRRLHGNGAAALLWDELGLPRPDLVTDGGNDGLMGRIATWSADQDRFTVEELATGLGFATLDPHMRRRMGDALRLLGFDKKKMRRGTGQIWGWYRPLAELAA